MSRPIADNSGTRLPNAGPQRTSSRRQFLGILGAGAATGVGFSGPAGAQDTPVVAMGNTYFDPVGLYVEPGTSVRFEIEAGSHSATAYQNRIPSEATPFDSGTMAEGGFEHTFETPGTYDYYCIPHKSMGMVGRIVVGEPGGPAEATPIPDGDVPNSEMIIEQGPIGIAEFDESDGDAPGGMMDSGPEMMDGGNQGWMMLVPIGFLTVVLGLVGGAIYWFARRGKPEVNQSDSAMATLEDRFVQGEIDEEEFRRRREQLTREE